MNSQQWLEELRTQLQKQALPSWHVERLVQELRDHLVDVLEEGRMDANSVMKLGIPVEIAKATGEEFRSRNFLQRHPRMKRFAFPTLALGILLVAGVLTIPSSLSAGDFVIASQIEDKAGKSISAPKVVVRPKQGTTIIVQDKKIEYRLSVKAGDEADASSFHTFNLRVVETDDTGKKSTLYAPRLSFTTGQEAFVENGGTKFRIKVTPDNDGEQK